MARSRARLPVHLVLLLASWLTLGVAGGVFWDGRFDELSGPVDGAYLWEIFRAGLPYAFWVVAILGAHEMGHYLACRFYRIPATLPFFIPAPPPLGSFGAVIRIRGRIPHRRALFDVAAAGPIAGFLLSVPALAWGLAYAQPLPATPVPEGATLEFGQPLILTCLAPLFTVHENIRINGLIGAGWVGMLVTSLNLFPVGQLDGGHAAYALSRRLHRALTYSTLAGTLILILAQSFLWKVTPAYLLWFAILLWMRDRHPPLLDETVPLGAGRKLVALALLAIFALSFIAMPFTFS